MRGSPKQGSKATTPTSRSSGARADSEDNEPPPSDFFQLERIVSSDVFAPPDDQDRKSFDPSRKHRFAPRAFGADRGY
jgi:hypothetical protein